MAIIKDNPILWHSTMPGWLRRASFLKTALLCAIAALVTAGLVIPALFLPQDTAQAVISIAVWCWAMGAVIYIGIMTVRAIIQERLQGTWDIILLTRLTPAEIIWGKSLAPQIQMWAVGVLLLPACIGVLCRSSQMDFWAALIMFSIAYASALFEGWAAGAIGIFFSLRSATLSNALLWSFGVFILGSWFCGPAPIIAGGVLLHYAIKNFAYVDARSRNEW
jgi:ABC-type transport system involved in multi-copper enzyme maturation permease subunit